jgi:hypothetical protein
VGSTTTPRYRLIKPQHGQDSANRGINVRDPRTAAPFTGFSLEDSHFAASKALSVYALWIGSPADRAGLRVGDRVTHMNGVRLTTLRQACTVFAAVAVTGDSLVLRVKPVASSGSGLARLLILPIWTTDQRFESTFPHLYFNLQRSIHLVRLHDVNDNEPEPQQMLFDAAAARKQQQEGAADDDGAGREKQKQL